MEDKNIRMAQDIASAVSDLGGRTYYVGGFVRDCILGIENKDIDIEVHGIPPQKLFSILKSLGDPKTVGASFGVFQLKRFDLDISMPRSERSTGRGHKDFKVFVDPFIGERLAASRRDFTMNALMQNVLTGEILDFFGGQKDIANRKIRHANLQSFSEDPLRVFRAAQFAARFDFCIADTTTALCSLIDTSSLSRERVMGELQKALLKAERPSVFFEELRKMKQLSVWFPEVETLIGVPQSEIHHPEGDVWTHTMRVLDEAARLRDQSSNPLYFMLAALCHDLGKPAVTREIDGRIRAIGHEKAGLPVADMFLSRLTNETGAKKYVLNMVELHMQPNSKAASTSKERPFMNMFLLSEHPEDLLLLAKADHLGRYRVPADKDALAESYIPAETTLRQMLDVYTERCALPGIDGNDLINAGMQSGPLMRDALLFAKKLKLANVPPEGQLKQAIAFARQKEAQRNTAR